MQGWPQCHSLLLSTGKVWDEHKGRAGNRALLLVHNRDVATECEVEKKEEKEGRREQGGKGGKEGRVFGKNFGNFHPH